MDFIESVVEKLKRKDPKTLAVATVIVVAVAAFLISSSVSGADEGTEVNDFQLTSTSEQLDESMFVAITGQVENPGVYELSSGELVIEIIRRAGGLTPDADLVYVHRDLKLASRVGAGQQIYIPSTSGSFPQSEVATKVSINSASLEQLTSITGIGEVTAGKIIESRPFASVEELLDVAGIGQSIYNKIATQVVL